MTAANDAPGAATFRVAAEAYDRHIGRYGPQELARALIAGAAGVEPGAARSRRRLRARRADRRARRGAGGAGSVVSVDPSEPFVRACRERNPEADVRTGTAERLPVADGAVDAVLSQLVLNFCSDPPAALDEMRRVARAGGVVAACVWDYAEGMELLRAFWDAAREIEPERGAAHDEAVVMPYCRRDELEGLWRRVGLRDVAGGEP